MIRWMLERLERDPGAVFYEKELLERFPADFDEAVESRLVRRVPIGSRYGYRLARPRMLEDRGDGTYEAYDDENPDEDPILLTEADLRRWRLDLDQIGQAFRERNGLGGEVGPLADRLYYLGEAQGVGVVLGLIREPKRALAIVLGLRALVPKRRMRTLVVCPSFVPTPSDARQLQSEDIEVVSLDDHDPFDLGAPLRAAGGARYIFSRDGDVWKFAFDSDTFRLKHMKGFEYIQYLLRHPEAELHALRLSAEVGGVEAGAVAATQAVAAGLRVGAGGDAVELLDRQAIDEYGQRAQELAAEIAEADVNNDPERAASAKQELAMFEEQLLQAQGLGGRRRRTGSAAEKARTNITNLIHRARKKIAGHSDGLGRHLAGSIKTGSVLSYQPVEPIDWNF